MNNQERDILTILHTHTYTTQRRLSDLTGHSLGIVNRSIKNLTREDYLTPDLTLTEKALQEFRSKSPRNAIILAAGFGMRMVPINMETPKALLKIHGEVLIERTIRHLHEVGIQEIYVVVGFLKEQFEYLIDEYGVELVVNASYAAKNNLHSLVLALDHLSNSYVIPCDLWCEKNPFCQHELYSWYMVSDRMVSDTSVRVNRKMELVSIPQGDSGNSMIGIAYLVEEQARVVRKKIRRLCRDASYDGAFWEEALYENDRMTVQARVVPAEDVVEINTYEQLRELDEGSAHLKSDAIAVIAKTLRCREDQVTDVEALKKGMTNRSFCFVCRGKKYMMRIPGEGTAQLLNRREEAEVYRVLEGRGICDRILYINPENGYKITEFLENARACDPGNEDDLKACMEKLKAFHREEIRIGHVFDLFKKIDFYESLWNGAPSVYRDYPSTKEKVLSLRPYIEDHVEKRVLSHIDAVPDNFLFVKNERGEEDVRLIDWEYAGMQDPHVDIAMFCIYSLYDKCQVDWLIDIYFEGACPEEIRIKIYCYISVCGLLWSNWCEYKRNLGVEFGEYSLRQYRYAKEYYRIAQERLKGGDGYA
ncbi:MAG: NTP transferase domain-containing protein [Lachnospiraceae bacterium]|nr:NTP transferase domain-containing protein [Lachnospiraceae bacterium]